MKKLSKTAISEGALRVATESLNHLTTVIKDYITALRNRKMRTALFYKVSENPVVAESMSPRQFNLVEVRELVSQVATARQLGFETILTVEGDKLIINFVEPVPQVPSCLMYLLL